MHIVQILPCDCFRGDFVGNDYKKTLVWIVVITLSVVAGLICLVWPLLAWWNVQIAIVETDFRWSRYGLQLFYIIQKIPFFNKLDACVQLIGDGLILSLLTQIYMYNEYDTSCLMFCFVPLLLLQNLYLVFENAIVDRLTIRRESWVQLVQPHVSHYYVLIYTCVIVVYSLADAVSLGWAHLRMWAYVPFLLLTLNRMMDVDNQILSKSKWILLFFGVTLYFFKAYFSLHLQTADSQSVEERQFPLYHPALAEEEVDSRYWWSKIDLSAFSYTWQTITWCAGFIPVFW